MVLVACANQYYHQLSRFEIKKFMSRMQSIESKAKTVLHFELFCVRDSLGGMHTRSEIAK